MLLACVVFMNACNDDDDGIYSGKPSTTTEQAFQRDFPTAEYVTWSKKKGYDVAKFTLPATRVAGSFEHTAWYPEGTDQNAYTKMEISWDRLQAEAPLVAEAWLASIYKAEGYELDDEIDVRTYAGQDPQYKLEAERGEVEYDLIYTKEGVLVSATLDDDDSDEELEDEPCPVQILDFIKVHFPEARIDESSFEQEFGYKLFVVEIEEMIEGRMVESELLFSDKFDFWRMVREVEDADIAKLPAALLDNMRQVAPETDWDEVIVAYDVDGVELGYYLIVEIEDEATDREEEHLYEFGLDGVLIKQIA